MNRAWYGNSHITKKKPGRSRALSERLDLLFGVGLRVGLGVGLGLRLVRLLLGLGGLGLLLRLGFLFGLGGGFGLGVRLRGLRIGAQRERGRNQRNKQFLQHVRNLLGLL